MSGPRTRPSAIILLLPLIAVLCLFPADSQSLPRPAPRPAFIPGELLVGFKHDLAAAGLADAAAAIGGMPGRRIPQINAQVFRFSAADNVMAVADRVSKLPGVRYAEPNYRRQVLLAAPNDPAYANKDTLIAPFEYDEGDPTTFTYFQWALRQIEAVAAWNVYPGTYYTQATKPANPPKIAVLDTGIDAGGPDGDPHDDFINLGGSSPDAAVGGQVDMANGRNVISGAPDPTDFADDYGHGTAIASVAVASANNGATEGAGKGSGIAGLAYHAQVLPVKVFDNTGNGTEADLAAGIIYAADHGALVINISGGDYYYSQTEQDAVDYAWAHGSLVIAAAGNDGNSDPLYPAALDGVIGAAATTWPFDDPATYSQFGYFVTIGAPGGDISYVPLGFWGVWVAMPTDPVPLHDVGWEPGYYQYQYHFGTSLASPHVAALASLYAAYKGITQATPNAPLLLSRALCRGCDAIEGTPGWNPHLGWGRINAYHTLLEDNNRGSTVGGIRGQVRYKDTVVANATINAALDGGAEVTAGATSYPDGMFRLANLTPGVYDVTAAYFGEQQTVQNVLVEAGYDVPRIRFNIGGSTPGNTPPVLSWVGTGGYVADGVDPDLAEHLTKCTFKVRYADADGDPPDPGVKLRLLRNGSELSGSPFDMTTGAVSDWAAGAVFRFSRQLRWGDYAYYFEASDGSANATGEPVNEADGPEIITPPLLANPRVSPDTGDASTRFRYRIDYSSLDGKPATWVQLQIRTYDPVAGWELYAWKKRNIADGTTVLWPRQVGTLYPDATRFRYRFRALKGGAGCRLIAVTDWASGPRVTGGTTAVMLSSLAAAPTKAGGAEIVFTLSAPADVQATILNVAGRPIRKLTPVAGVQGLNTLLWDGRSSAGLHAPGGAYLVEVNARSPEGAQSRALAPLRLSR